MCSHATVTDSDLLSLIGTYDWDLYFYLLGRSTHQNLMSCSRILNSIKGFKLNQLQWSNITLHMGMGMSVSPQIWQQFVDLVFQDDLIKRKQNFNVIMDDTFIHSTAKEHMDDLMDLFKVLRKYVSKISPHKCQFLRKR